MQLASQLRLTTLGDLLAELHRVHANGVLELIEPHARHAIHLRRGLVQAVESDALATRLGDVAMQTCGLTRSQVERARWFAGAHDLRLGQALVAAGFLKPGQLDVVLRAQQQDRLDRLFQVREAEVRFRVARPLPPGASEQRPLAPNDVYFGRPRKRTRQATARMAQPRPANARSRALAALGLGPEAGRDQARAAYQKLVLALHPDRVAKESAVQQARKSEQLQQVIEAWRVLDAR